MDWWRGLQFRASVLHALQQVATSSSFHSAGNMEEVEEQWYQGNKGLPPYEDGTYLHRVGSLARALRSNNQLNQEKEKEVEVGDGSGIVSHPALAPPDTVAVMLSPFAAPFLFKPPEKFTEQIFPPSKRLSKPPLSFIDIFTEPRHRGRDVVGAMGFILDQYTTFYTESGQTSHYGQFTGKEILFMAQHLKQKLTIDLTNDDNSDNELTIDENEEETEENKTFILYPELFHDFTEDKAIHKYRVCSQFYRMLLKGRPNQNISSKEIENPADAIASLELIENEVQSAYFSACQAEFRDTYPSTPSAFKEVLLFHGTNSCNIRSIFEDNFDLGAEPVGRDKRSVYGHGVYLSQFPEVALNYGDTLVVCRVLLGRVQAGDWQDCDMKAAF